MCVCVRERERESVLSLPFSISSTSPSLLSLSFPLPLLPPPPPPSPVPIQAMSFIIRDYVESWYHKHVTLDGDFIKQTRLSAQSALRVLAAQCKSADWLDLLTLQFTDELIQHFKMYRQACDRLPEVNRGEDGSSSPVEGEGSAGSHCKL